MSLEADQFLKGECSSILDVEIRRLEWAKRLDEQTLCDFIKNAEVVEFEASQVAIELGTPIHHVYFVISGSFRVTLTDQLGHQRYQTIVRRGAAIGLLAMAFQKSSLIRVEAMEPSTTARLSFDQLLAFGSRSQAFQVAMYELTAGLFLRASAAERKLQVPATVGIVHISHRTSMFTTRLLNRLAELSEQPCLMSDLPSEGLSAGIAFQSFVHDSACISPEQRRDTIKSWAARGRLILDLTVGKVGDELVSFLGYVDKVLWCIGEGELDESLKHIEELNRVVPWIKDKLSVVWCLGEMQQVAPYAPRLAALIDRDFKLSFCQSSPNAGKQLQFGFERVVHYLRGIQIGLALGGGAARGMAHLGVLRSLEDLGIVVDRIAGTSAGAMTGTIYSLGLEPNYATTCFKTDLLPSWLFRKLPAGGYWYLLYKYRRGLFDPMLRRYLRDYRMEQLPIPMTTVAVDLVDGEPRVRTQGDATRNVLESINLPPLSLPLFDNDQALVDGGLLNNVPANLLVSQGCNFVIASTVTAQLDKDFMGIRKRGKPKASMLFSTVQVMMRQALIQNYSMNAIGVSPADFVIAPDVTAFDISEFTRADEMATIGADVASAQGEELKSQLRRLDAGLFS